MPFLNSGFTKTLRSKLRRASCLSAAGVLVLVASTCFADDEQTTQPEPLSLGMHPPASQPAGPPPGFFIWPEPAPLEGTIATDRPGFSDTTSVVPRGHVQWEMGYTYSYDKGPDHYRLQTQDFPEGSLRIGVIN